ncbi:MAG: carboxypeptidase-like regulatory domain-containing protein, partial [Bacteroidales bacterium]|nr:carboxypeptidase-like regulatory domain-containing protein [Bacteroidales bacterium]
MKGLKFLTCTVLSAILLTLVNTAVAQRANRVNIKGVVTEQTVSGASETVPFATVQIPSLGITVVANEKGEYQMVGITPATYEFVISCLGYETQTLKVNVTAAKGVYN